MSNKWFEYHHDATRCIRKLRNSARSDERRIKIAILDSGIQLSSTQKEQYGFDSGVVYRSFIDPEDGSAEWNDEAGHGTHLAVLLRKIAENADIHVARVFKKKPNGVNSPKGIAKVHQT